MGKIKHCAPSKKMKDSWRSDQRIISPLFKKVPICIFSSTEDKIVNSILHRKMYARAIDAKATDKDVPSKTDF